MRADEHLVEDDPNEKRSDALVERVPERLLGAQVVERPDDHPLARLPRRGGGVLRPLHHQLGEAEVEDLHAAVGRDHDVGGRDVPVQDPPLVRGLQALERLDARCRGTRRASASAFP